MNQKEKVCERCGGVGQYQIGADRMKRCMCSFTRGFVDRVGLDIAHAKRINSSPLYLPGAPGKPLEDNTKENLFISSWWEALLPHLRYALLWKLGEFDLHYYFHITDDERLKSVYLGNEAYKSRPRAVRDTQEAMNGLRDLIGPMYQLVIIRIGHLGYANRAMPGILKEACMIRKALNLPTWIVEEPNYLFEPGHRSHSYELEEYFNRYYRKITIESENGKAPPPRSVPGMSLDEDDDELFDTEDEPSRSNLNEAVHFAHKASSVPPPAPADNIESLAGMVTGTASKSKKPKKGWRK